VGAARPPEELPGAASRALDPDPVPVSAALKAADGGGTRGENKPPPPSQVIFFPELYIEPCAIFCLIP